MQWQFDEQRTTYRLDAAPYRAIIWREPSGEWTGRIEGPGETRLHHGFTWWENAQAWCEHGLAELGVVRSADGPEIG